MSVSRDEESKDEDSDASRSERFRFPALCRLRSAADFQRVYRTGQRVGDDHLLIVGVRSDQQLTRIGLSVSRKHGTAVVRNRKKRLMREAFRTVRGILPSGLDLILIPRQSQVSTMQDYQASLRQLAERLERKLLRADRSSQRRQGPSRGAQS